MNIRLRILLLGAILCLLSLTASFLLLTGHQRRMEEAVRFAELPARGRYAMARLESALPDAGDIRQVPVAGLEAIMAPATGQGRRDGAIIILYVFTETGQPIYSGRPEDGRLPAMDLGTFLTPDEIDQVRRFRRGFEGVEFTPPAVLGFAGRAFYSEILRCYILAIARERNASAWKGPADSIAATAAALLPAACILVLLLYVLPRVPRGGAAFREDGPPAGRPGLQAGVGGAQNAGLLRLFDRSDPVRLDELLKEILEKTTLYARQHDITMYPVIQDLPLSTLGSACYLRWVIGDVLDHAVSRCSQGGQIFITARREMERVVMEVAYDGSRFDGPDPGDPPEETGPGSPDDTKQDAGQDAGKMDETRRLHTAAHLLRSMQGDLFLTAGGPDGSVLRLELPFHPHPPEQPGSKEPADS